MRLPPFLFSSMEPFFSSSPVKPRGFTLVEMVVVLAIISVITGIALMSQSTFNRSLLLTNTAYTVALSIRQMQSLGLSSRVFDTVQNTGYGVHVAAATPESYLLFADISNTPGSIPANCVTGTPDTPEEKPGNCLYDTDGTPDGIVETFSFSRGYTISRFCGNVNTSTRYCSTDSVSPLSALDIAFVRSNTEIAANGYRNGVWVPFVSAEIYISSADGTSERGICVSRVGQVSVTTETCP